MQESIWDSERISNIGWILSRYSEHIQNGDRIRMGIEGDPCGAYRGEDEAPCGTVTSVTRSDDGFVQFNMRLDTSGEEVSLDNRNVAPEKVWEVHPDFVETFRGRVHGPDEDDGDAEEPSEKEEEHEEPSDDFRSAVETRVESLGERLQRMETVGSELERTIASAVRELCGDLMRTYRGETPDFSFQYADRYDLALAKRDDDAPTDDFRGAVKKKSTTTNKQSEKFSFDVESLGLRESSVLSE